jgi:hypothetical protein
MDPLANPYSMGAGNPPPALTGREPQKDQFRALLGRLRRNRSEQSMIIFGLRGVGKTVLLLEFESIADAEGWMAPDPLEIRSDTDFRAELADAAYQALLRLDRRKALGERLKAFTGILRGFKVGASVEGKVEFSFDPDAVSASTGVLSYRVRARRGFGVSDLSWRRSSSASTLASRHRSGTGPALVPLPLIVLFSSIVPVTAMNACAMSSRITSGGSLSWSS